MLCSVVSYFGKTLIFSNQCKLSGKNCLFSSGIKRLLFVGADLEIFGGSSVSGLGSLDL